MKFGIFKANDWIEQLAGALPQLAEAQTPYLLNRPGNSGDSVV